MTSKCKKCGKFLPAEATGDTCVACTTATAVEAVQKMAQTTSEGTKSVNTTTSSVFRFEVPTFIEGQQGGIQIWLRQVDVCLKLAKITTEQEKYKYLIASLPSEIINRVFDLINEQPPSNPYTTLVQRIESEFQPTESGQVKKLLQGMIMGDKKPSLFLREMRELAKNQVTDVVLKELFLAQLPEALRRILVVIESASLDSLAAAADRGWESSGLSVIASAEAIPAQSGTEQRMNELMGKMVEVLDRMSRRDEERKFTRRDRSQTPGARRDAGRRERSNSRKRNPKWKLCRYHYKFGENAHRCESWCEKWQGDSKNLGNGTG